MYSGRKADKKKYKLWKDVSIIIQFNETAYTLMKLLPATSQPTNKSVVGALSTHMHNTFGNVRFSALEVVYPPKPVKYMCDQYK